MVVTNCHFKERHDAVNDREAVNRCERAARDVKGGAGDELESTMEGNEERERRDLKGWVRRVVRGKFNEVRSRAAERPEGAYLERDTVGGGVGGEECGEVGELTRGKDTRLGKDDAD